MNKRKTRNYPDMFAKRVRKGTQVDVLTPLSGINLDVEDTMIPKWEIEEMDLTHELKRRMSLNCLPIIMALIICVCSVSCSTKHYFSINAEEITNPSILYSDSTGLTNPF